jgi:hypothetical protein
MSHRHESSMDRLRNLSWLQWGLITIFGGLMSGVIGNLQGAPSSRAEAAGRGAASLLFIVIGVVLIIVHFVRPKAKKDQRKQTNTSQIRSANRRPTSADEPGLPPRRSKPKA